MKSFNAHMVATTVSMLRTTHSVMIAKLESECSNESTTDQKMAIWVDRAATMLDKDAATLRDLADALRSQKVEEA